MLLIYIIKCNIILALLCLLFQTLMHRDTYFGVRRAMLLGIYATAMLLPLWNVQGWMATQAETSEMAEAYASYVLPTLDVTAQRVAFFGIHQDEPGCGMWVVGFLMLWGLVYLIPVVWLTAKLLWQLGYIIYLRFTCRPTPLPLPDMDGSGYYYYYPKPCSPFSFGPWIFMHTDGISENELREVLIHEQTHVRQWHTLDIILAQLFCIVFWWNPATWVLRREVRLNLEFIADAAVVGKNADRRTYQYHLLGFVSQTNVATLANNFNVLPLKRRIVMMNSRRTRRTGMVKYALFVPVAAALLFFSNIDSLARSIAKEVKPLANIEQVLTNTEMVAPVLEDVQPVAEEPAVDQVETMVEVAAMQDTEQPEMDSTENAVSELTRINDKALWIVDNNVSTPEDCAKLNPNDIENITVLKDKAATDLWGSKGEKGVIMITTKNAEKDDNDKKGQIYEDPEFKAEYPGGEPELLKFLQTNIKYPAVAQEYAVQGRIIVSFVIEKDGSITEIKPIPEKKLENALNEVVVTAGKPDATPEEKVRAEKYAEGLEQLKEEAQRVVSLMPKWKPGRQNDEPVRVRFMLPISFRLR